MFDLKNKKEYDVISEQESELSVSVSLNSISNSRCHTARGNQEEVEELYLGEPKWAKSSSWVKPVPHRVYKVRAVWSYHTTFDTEVRRRYKHFVWLRKVLIKDYEH